MKMTWLRLLGLWFALGLAAPAFATVILSVGSQTVTQGNLTTVDVNVSGLGNGTALGGYDLNVGFDPSLLSFSSVAYGDPVLGDQLNLGFFSPLTLTTPGTGTTDIAELSLDPSFWLTSFQAPSFTLAALTFDALSPGLSSLTLSVNALADQNGNSISPGIVIGSIDVSSAGNSTPVPEPGTLALFAVGLVGLAWSNRRILKRY